MIIHRDNFRLADMFLMKLDFNEETLKTFQKYLIVDMLKINGFVNPMRLMV